MLGRDYSPCNPFLSFLCFNLVHTLSCDQLSVRAQSCLTLCDPLLSLPGFSVRGIFQARILEWVAIFSSKGSSQPRD